MKSWKTTLFGVLTAVCYLGYKLLTHQPIDGQDFALAGGMIGLGTFSKDNNVTGGTTKQ